MVQGQIISAMAKTGFSSSVLMEGILNGHELQLLLSFPQLPWDMNCPQINPLLCKVVTNIICSSNASVSTATQQCHGMGAPKGTMDPSCCHRQSARAKHLWRASPHPPPKQAPASPSALPNAFFSPPHSPMTLVLNKYKYFVSWVLPVY